MRDFSEQLADLRRRVSDAAKYLNVEAARARYADLEVEASRPDLWDDADNARKVTTELARVGEDIELLDRMERELGDAEAAWDLAREESDDSLEGEIAGAVTALERDLDALELRALFAGEYDERDAICTVHSGAGGTDAQDWAEMLLRMYVRWAERRGFGVEIDEIQPGDEAGITSATFTLKGRYAFGLVQAERGVHRLVRISPFDAQSRRHTAFASFDAIPVIEEDEGEVEVNEKDLRVDTFRSSGAGGQHVNVTDSAVRITHLPTGIVVACQAERSQHQNRDRAMGILKARLAQLAREERQKELDELSGDKTDVAWGNQIRSYVLAPYQMVKDLRTEHETGNVDAVLDGDLDPFVEAYLHWRRRER